MAVHVAGPGGPADPPPDPLAQYRLMFASLDTDLPLALLPIRMETRFSGTGGTSMLTVRLFPDVLHADGHAPMLTASEVGAGKAFWTRCWPSLDDVAAQDAAFAWLAGLTGPWRAAWVARVLTPTNLDAARRHGTPIVAGPARPPVNRPVFPDVDVRDTADPVRARLLPWRFLLCGYVEGELAGTWLGNEIPADLPLAPALVDGATPDSVISDGTVAGAESLLNAQGLQWLHDLDAAVEAGMAVRIDLGALENPAARQGFDRLVAFGISAGDQQAAVEALLTAQRYTRGLDLAPQGMPTNRTEAAADALYLPRPDLSAVRRCELTPADAGPRPRVTSDGDLLRATAADAAAVAFGLGRDTAVDRASEAAGRQGAWAEGMNRALWPVLLGTYLRELAGGVLDDMALDWLRPWSTTFVRGGAPLPTLLVGAQPYGVLPVSRIAALDPALDHPTTNVAHIERLLSQLRRYWDDSLPGVAHLDPNAADAPGDALGEGDLAATVSQVLGSVPHPAGLLLRDVEPKRNEYVNSYNGWMLLLGLGCTQFPDAAGHPYPDQGDNPAWQRFLRLEDDVPVDAEHAFVSASTDFHHTAGVDGVDFTSQQLQLYGSFGDFIDDYLLPLVRAHQERTAPVAALLLGQDTDVSFFVGDEDDPQAFFAYHGDTGSETPWTLPLVADGHTPADVAGVNEWLGDLTAGAVDDQGGQPLLRQLLASALSKAEAGDETASVADGLATLREVVASGADPASSADPVGELERLLRETLGAASYRIDAWFSAVAAWRLENKRARRPHGLQVGTYGMLVDVRRREGRGSQGYVAAPSLDQAITAAVLRAGWSAMGGSATPESGDMAGLALDLSSERIRRAAWLLDGVRRGQDLGQLLGSRLERRLHEAGLDTWVEPLRSLALTAAGRDGPPTGIVDGLLLARARSGAADLDPAEQAAADGLDALLADPHRPAGNPAPTLEDLTRDLDAVADALVAQTTHALAKGQTATATAALTTASSGEIAPPPLTFADTPRPALQVHHRLAVLTDSAAEGTWPGAATSWRALAAPGVEAWAATVLPDPASVPVAVRFVDAAWTTTGQVQASLADTGLAALDVVYLVPGAEETGLGRLADALTVWGYTVRAPGVAGTPVIDVADELNDVALAARAVRKLLAGSRDIDARDLAEPKDAGVTAAGVDPSDLTTREERVRAAVSAVRDRLFSALDPATADPAGQRAALAAVLGGQVPGGLAAPDDTALADHVSAVLASLDARLVAHDQLVEAGAALTDRLGLLVGQQLPLAARFSVGNGAVLAASAARPRASAPDVTGWLQQCGRVDPGAEQLRVAVDLCEAVGDRSVFSFRVAQLPDYPDEPWVALQRPAANERGRVNVLLTGAELPLDGSGPLAGLVVGGWNEAVPRTPPAAGLAVNVDAASSRAPQAVLLCVARDEDGFTLENVRDLVVQALDLARLRMVGPEVLAGLGQYLPATYLPATITASTPGGPA